MADRLKEFAVVLRNNNWQWDARKARGKNAINLTCREQWKEDRATLDRIAMPHNLKVTQGVPIATAKSIHRRSVTFKDNSPFHQLFFKGVR